jgi:hypothetical protein
VQTCSKCNALSSDAAPSCVHCGVDLLEYSTRAVTLKRLRENPRVRHIILSVHDDCCHMCLEMQGAYSKEEVPGLPVEGCSHPNGCRCFYQPVLNDIYP